MTEQALAGDQVCVFGPNGRQHRERHWGAPPGDGLVAGESVDAVLRAICGQPAALADALCGRLDGGGAHFRDLPLDPKRLRQVERIILTACGTSYHAALVGEYLFEEFARIPVEVEHAAEFRDRNAPIDGHTLVVALCPSGATADTVAALRECR